MPGIDRTMIAMLRQLDAMAVSQVEIGALNPDMEVMKLRSWNRDQLKKSLPWLKQQNAAGCHIYVRPEGSQGISLVDDLSISALARMEQDGTQASCIVETSPHNYQAWVRVSPDPIPHDLATAVGKVLARRYAGDLNSIDWRHFGRLAGFTNRKPAYVNESGRYPYVLLRHAVQKLTPNAKNILGDATKILASEREPIPTTVTTISLSDRSLEQIKNRFRAELHGLIGRFGQEIDYSKADWMIAKKLLALGVQPDVLADVLRTTSPAIAIRKKGHVEDYIQRTLDKLTSNGAKTLIHPNT